MKITLASSVIHNYLREHRSEGYTPTTLETADQETVPGQMAKGHFKMWQPAFIFTYNINAIKSIILAKRIFVQHLFEKLETIKMHNRTK